MEYRVAEMFGKIAELKVAIFGKKLGEWKDFSHKDTNEMLKFGWLKFVKAQIICQIRQTFPLPNILAMWYIIIECIDFATYVYISVDVTHTTYTVHTYMQCICIMCMHKDDIV